MTQVTIDNTFQTLPTFKLKPIPCEVKFPGEEFHFSIIYYLTGHVHNVYKRSQGNHYIKIILYENGKYKICLII